MWQFWKAQTNYVDKWMLTCVVLEIMERHLFLFLLWFNCGADCQSGGGLTAVWLRWVQNYCDEERTELQNKALKSGPYAHMPWAETEQRTISRSRVAQKSFLCRVSRYIYCSIVWCSFHISLHTNSPHNFINGHGLTIAVPYHAILTFGQQHVGGWLFLPLSWINLHSEDRETT